MSKKDFQAIARAIHGERGALSLDSAALETVNVLTRALADVLQASNPRFDRARFVETCETERCKGMAR